MNIASPGGVFGSYDGADSLVGNKDSYAPGTTVIPKVLGAYTRAGKIKLKNKRRKKK